MNDQATADSVVQCYLHFYEREWNATCPVYRSEENCKRVINDGGEDRFCRLVVFIKGAT